MCTFSSFCKYTHVHVITGNREGTDKLFRRSHLCIRHDFNPLLTLTGSMVAVWYWRRDRQYLINDKKVTLSHTHKHMHTLVSLVSNTHTHCQPQNL